MSSQKGGELHDNLAKWLILTFSRDFFRILLHRRVYKVLFINSEFINTNPGLKAAVRADLFLQLEMDIEGVRREVLAIIENKSRWGKAADQLIGYYSHALTTGRQPVWNIAFFSTR